MADILGDAELGGFRELTLQEVKERNQREREELAIARAERERIAAESGATVSRKRRTKGKSQGNGVPTVRGHMVLKTSPQRKESWGDAFGEYEGPSRTKNAESSAKTFVGMGLTPQYIGNLARVRPTCGMVDLSMVEADNPAGAEREALRDAAKARAQEETYAFIARDYARRNRRKLANRRGVIREY